MQSNELATKAKAEEANAQRRSMSHHKRRLWGHDGEASISSVHSDEEHSGNGDSEWKGGDNSFSIIKGKRMHLSKQMMDSLLLHSTPLKHGRLGEESFTVDPVDPSLSSSRIHRGRMRMKSRRYGKVGYFDDVIDEEESEEGMEGHNKSNIAKAMSPHCVFNETD